MSPSRCSRGRRWWQAQLAPSRVDICFRSTSNGRRLTYLDDDFSFHDEAEDEVDALVSDDTFDQYMQAQSGVIVPPGFESGTASPAPAQPVVPRAPPGLSSAVVTPEQTKRKPATPSRTISTHREPAQGALQEEDFPALAPKAQDQSTTPSIAGTPVAKKATLAKSAERAEKAAERAAEKAAKKEARDAEKAAKRAAKEAERAAKDAEREEKAAKKAAEKAAAEKKAAEDKAAAKAAETPSTPAKAKKPITLDTKAAPSQVSSAAPEKASFPPLPDASAASPSAPRAAPKTLRLVSTPKPEVPSIGSPVSAVSRAMSSSNIRPGSPPGEIMSETASMVSASVSASRAGSPPPTEKSVIGSAHVRTATKSQQRKHRKDATKQDSKVLAETVKETVPEEHAPIMGRKKKQKKEKAIKIKPEKPVPKLQEDTPEEEPAEPDEEQEASPSPKPEPVAEDSEESEESGSDASEPDYGPAAVFEEISRSLSHAIDKLNMFNPVAVNTRADKKSALKPASDPSSQLPGPCKDSTCKCAEITEAELVTQSAGNPVRKQFHMDGSRMLITPNGDCIRTLSKEEEDRFLQLQASIAAEAEHPGTFVFQRHQPGNGAFSLIKGRAVPNGRPNIFPASSQPHGQDPIGKLQREDALSYINQYVLPRLNLGATNVGWPKGATVRQDAAAASLNSLAPYFYGPDAAAGVGIYSAPDTKEFASANPALAGAPGQDGVANWSAGMGATPAVSGMPLMSVEDAEAALGAAKKETEKLQKRLEGLIRSNRRIVLSRS